MITKYVLLWLLLLQPANLLFAGGIKGKVKVSDEYLNNVVVYLQPVEKSSFPPPTKAAVMDQINLNFEPHVLPVLVGTKVVFPNSDKIRHSVFSNSKPKKFDFGTYSPGTEKSIMCDQPGVIPILCYIHHDMSAYIVVLTTPYFGVSNDDGEYHIDNVPAAKYRLTFWHEDVQIKSEDVSIPAKGTVTRNITQ